MRRSTGPPGTTAIAAAAVWLLVGAAMPTAAQQPGKPRPGPRPPQGSAAPHDHGTPKGWKLAWPKGDPGQGRQVFAKLECYSCHEVRGETFPVPSEKESVGPELSVMGPLHEAEYFAEAVINPGATIEKGKGYQAPDGSSKMPSFNDSLTVQELIDLVAFLRSLKPPGGGQTTPREHRGH